MSATAPCVWATARVANLAWSHCTHPTTVDTIVSGDIQTNGCFECESVAAILTTMRQQRPSLLVDIGGNIGMYTAAAATQGHRVHTYEPVPTNAARIRETLRRNRLEQRVTLYEACLGPAPGWAALGKNATNQRVGSGMSWSRPEPTPALTAISCRSSPSTHSLLHLRT